MTAAWGDHGEVSKTWLPGKGYESAAKIVQRGGKPALREAVRRQRDTAHAVHSEEKAHFQKYREQQDSINQLVGRLRGGKGLKSPEPGVLFKRPDMATAIGMKATGTEAFALRTGGKNGQRIMVVPKGSTANTIAHEVAHLTPKRSSYRLHQITNDGTKTMREEARADMATGDKGAYYKTMEPATSGYVRAARDEPFRVAMNANERQMNALSGNKTEKFTRENIKAFRGTQDRIRGAQTRSGQNTFHGNKYVDDKGNKRFGMTGVQQFTVGAWGTAGAGLAGRHYYKKRKAQK